MRFMLYCSGVIAVCVMGVLLYRSTSKAPHALESRQNPVGIFPSPIVIQSCEAGEELQIPVSFSNTGNAALHVFNIQSSCSCSGIERTIEGRRTQLSSFVVSPGTTESFTIRYVVREAQPGTSFAASIKYESNDPRQSTGEVSISVGQVRGGVHIVPRALHLGEILAGSDFKAVVDVFDDSVSPRTITTVRCSLPGVAADLIQPLESQSPHGRRIGQVVISGKFLQPKDIEGSLSVYFSGGESLHQTIPIFGRIVAMFRVVPESIRLPRNSGQGLVYESNLLLRGTKGHPFRFETEAIAKWLRFDSPTNTQYLETHNCRLVIDPAILPSSLGASEHRIKIRCIQTDGGSQIIDLHLMISTPGAAK